MLNTYPSALNNKFLNFSFTSMTCMRHIKGMSFVLTTKDYNDMDYHLEKINRV